MGGEEGFAAEALGRVGDVLHDGPGDAHAVESRGAAANFVQHNEALGCGVLENFGHFGHLDHEGGLAGGKVVRCANAGKDGIHDAHMTAGRWDEGADLCHQGDKGVLAHIRRFACHIRASDDETAVSGAVEPGIVGDEEAAFQHLLDHRVAALGDGQLVAVIHHRAAVVVFSGHLRQCRQHVQLGHSICRPLDAVELTSDRFQQFREEPVLQRNETLMRT